MTATLTHEHRQLLLMVAESLSGPSKLGNTKAYGRICARRWRSLNEAWVAAGLGEKAPIACHWNGGGGPMTAKDHHAAAARIRAAIAGPCPRCNGTGWPCVDAFDRPCSGCDGSGAIA